MPVTTRFSLGMRFPIRPEGLLGVPQRLPITFEGYIPLDIDNIRCDLLIPTIIACGNGAVRMTIGNEKRFGFMKDDRHGKRLQTPQTKELILSEPESGPSNIWDGTVTTPEPLSEVEVELFAYGAGFFIDHAVQKIQQAEAAGIPVAATASPTMPLHLQQPPSHQPW
jgi:hypothetical protein